VLLWLGRPFLSKVNGGRFSIHQQEAAPFEIVHYVIAPSQSKLALVLRDQTVQAVQFSAYFLPRDVLGVTTWHTVNSLNRPNSRAAWRTILDDEGQALLKFILLMTSISNSTDPWLCGVPAARKSRRQEARRRLPFPRIASSCSPIMLRAKSKTSPCPDAIARLRPQRMAVSP